MLSFPFSHSSQFVEQLCSVLCIWSNVLQVYPLYAGVYTLIQVVLQPVIANLLSKCSSEYTCTSVQTPTKSGYSSTLLLYTPYTLASYIQQTQSPKWSLYSQLLTFNDCTCNNSQAAIAENPFVHIQGYMHNIFMHCNMSQKMDKLIF